MENCWAVILVSQNALAVSVPDAENVNSRIKKNTTLGAPSWELAPPPPPSSNTASSLPYLSIILSSLYVAGRHMLMPGERGMESNQRRNRYERGFL